MQRQPNSGQDGNNLVLVLDRRWILWESLVCLALIIVIFWGLSFFKNGAPAMPVPVQAAPTDRSNWILTFSDEFDGAAMDTTKWSDAYPGDKRTHENNEQQYYAPDGWKVEGGHIRFTAQKRSMGGMPYTSGMISSADKFSQQYGLFEIRTRVPKGKGMWPAFWLLPATKKWPPEIDIMEIVGHEPNIVLMSTHWGQDYHSRRYQTGKWSGPDFTADFHTFAVEWTANEIIWYVDGVERHRIRENIPQEPMYVLSNLAVGGDLPGMPDATTPFPGVMEVDYIRVYQRAP